MTDQKKTGIKIIGFPQLSETANMNLPDDITALRTAITAVTEQNKDICQIVLDQHDALMLIAKNSAAPSTRKTAGDSICHAQQQMEKAILVFRSRMQAANLQLSADSSSLR